MDSSLYAQIDKDFRFFLKNRGSESDLLKLSVLRMLISDIKNKSIDLRIKNLDINDQDILLILKKAIKSREESYALYQKANRLDLAEKEEKELDILKTYMPESISSAEILKCINEVILDLQLDKNFTLTKDKFGIIMKHVMSKLSLVGKPFDNKIVTNTINSKLS